MHQRRQLDFDEIVRLINSPLKPGDTWYLLDKKWYDMCKAYHESGDKSTFPGAIDNSALFQPITSCTKFSNGFSPADSTTSSGGGKFKQPMADAVSVDSRPLRTDLSEAEGHFIVVPEKCWNLLKETYGITSINHAIKRRVIEVTPGQAIVEIRPISLRLCLYGGKEATVERSFSRITTLDELQQEMRSLFNVNSDRETMLWINSSVYTFKPRVLSSSSKADNVQTSSPNKPPPTPPPMPSTNPSANLTKPTVVTRQAANSMNKPIPLPDSSTSPTTRSSALSTSTLDSTAGSTSTKEGSLAQTLADIGVSDSTIVTLEVINADGTWPSSKPRYGTVSTRSSKAQPGLCGLSNMGNTCFMNAALQCLSNTPPLTNYILEDKFVGDINIDNPLGMHGEIARTYAELIKVMWSGNNASFLPREFKCAVSRFAPQFNGFAQQDCQELMAFLLDGLHEDLNRIRNKPYIEIKNDIDRRPDEIVAEESWSNYKKRNDSIVVDTFHAMLKSTLVCPGCKLVSVTFDPFCYLSLPLPVKREKQVNLTFLSAPSRVDASRIKVASTTLDYEEIKTVKQFGGAITSFSGAIEEYAGYANPENYPKSCKMQVPRSGPASEICEIVARIINEEKSPQSDKVKQDNLVVAELSSDGRISKVYESNEHYNQISDDVVVVEKASNYVVPLYLRERKNKNSIAGTVIAKPLFLHVPDLKFETLYRSTIASLSNLTDEFHEKLQADAKAYRSWIKLSTPPEVPLFREGKSESSKNSNSSQLIGSALDSTDCEDDNSNEMADSTDDGDEIMDTGTGDLESNGNGSNFQAKAFDLCIVNSFGNHSIERLTSDNKECDYSSKLYLGATFTPTTASLPQFAHIRQSKFGDSAHVFTPKVSPKPTLQLKDCITQFTNLERLGADDPWYCPKCKKHQQATKKFDIWSLPKVLIIHLKRFSFSRSWRDKIDTLVDFPVENLDMSCYVLNPNQRKQKQLMYNLIGVANHFGGLGGGHYTAFAKNAPQQSWYSFDDALVTPTSSNNVVTRSAYVLFYQLQQEE